jgi:hypothetical protein
MRYTKYQILASIVILLLSSLWWVRLASAQIPAGSSARSTSREEDASAPCVSLREFTCPLSLSQATELRGFRLGMSLDQVISRFPGLIIESGNDSSLKRIELIFLDGLSDALNPKDVTNKRDLFKAYINRERFKDFDGVYSIILRFLDDRIFYIRIKYEGQARWTNLDEFTSKISEGLSLPKGWQRCREDYSDSRKLECSGFRATTKLGNKSDGITPDYFNGPELALEDVTAEKKMEQRRKDIEDQKRRAEEERRKSFKP